MGQEKNKYLKEKKNSRIDARVDSKMKKEFQMIAERNAVTEADLARRVIISFMRKAKKNKYKVIEWLDD